MRYCKHSDSDLFQALIFITIILLAMMGNLLVIVSVLRTNNLRRQKAYYFVVSLAVAGISIMYQLYIKKLDQRNLIFNVLDLLVSIGAMVFNAITVILNGQWIFSVWLCDMYNAMDVVFSTASILNLFCISMYRLVSGAREQIREEIDPINSSWLWRQMKLI